MSQAIIQSKTYAETEAIFALATGTYNNTYAGTEIYVSDKSWHLLCYYDREAKPKSGVLKINNGDTLPNWLTPERLIVQTTTLTGDYSITPYEIAIPNGYTLLGAWIETLDYYEAISLQASIQGRVVDELSGQKCYILMLNTDGSAYDLMGTSRVVNLLCTGSAGIIVSLDLMKTQ